MPEGFFLQKGGIAYGTWNYCETAGGKPQVQGHDFPLAFFGQKEFAVPVQCCDGEELHGCGCAGHCYVGERGVSRDEE